MRDDLGGLDEIFLDTACGGGAEGLDLLESRRVTLQRSVGRKLKAGEV
jgi:hypothetical protein